MKYIITVRNCGDIIYKIEVRAYKLDYYIKDNSIVYNFRDEQDKVIDIVNIPTLYMSHIEVKNG